MISILYSGISGILNLIGRVFVFEKMGEEGWKGVIPVYNKYILYKNLWNVDKFKAFLVCMIGSVLCAFGTILCNHSTMSLLPACFAGGLVFAGVALMLEIQLTHKLSKHFGHGIGYTLGLIFLSPIFYMVLGLNNNKYVQFA